MAPSHYPNPCSCLCRQELVRESISADGVSKVPLTFRNMELFEKFNPSSSPAAAAAAASSSSAPSKSATKEGGMREAFV